MGISIFNLKINLFKTMAFKSQYVKRWKKKLGQNKAK